ncbi:MAG: helix-turn-helix transcriptional regulator [Bacteroidota bacterium]
MSKKEEPTYHDLNKRLSDEEIAESFVLRSTLAEEERQLAEEEFKKLRMRQLMNMSDDQILQGELIRMKLLMKDYFQQDVFLSRFSFGNQLKKYISLLNISHAQFADDIHLHKTKLSRLINSREKPNIELMYRLEVHSGSVIPATYWYKLFSKQVEAEIKSNENMRAIESEKVKNALNVKRSA